MTNFIDADGRTWNIRITMRSAAKVKEKTGHNLTTLLDDGLGMYAELCCDVLEITRIVSVLIAEQLEEAGVTADEFSDAVHGDVIDAMANAFNEAFCDFIPSHQGAILRNLMATSMKEQKEARQKILSELTSTELDSSLPESVELTPGTTH